MIDAIALAKAAKDEDEFQQEQEKKKPFILKVLKAVWNFIICDRAFFILSRENFIRRFACWFCTWGPFEWFILATILCTTGVMAAEHHLPNNDQTPLSISLV